MMTENQVKPPCVDVTFPIHRVDEGLVCLDCGQYIPILILTSGFGHAMQMSSNSESE